jgi:ribonuclease HII
MPGRNPALFPTLEFEQVLWQSDVARVAGIDEAGRGAWAGPVCAAAVVLPPDASLLQRLDGVRDSKLMTPAQRDAWAPVIKACALSWGVGFASAGEIDTLGILPATRLAALRALEACPADHLLTDLLLFRELELPQTALVRGDRRSLSVAAASVLAKTARDAQMIELEEEYPGYGFARHKGYGTQVHQAALARLGLCREHRRSFRITHPE